MNNAEQLPLEMNAIIPPSLAIGAMRSSGYRSTAHALAELVDNSIQAEANAVEVICVEGRINGGRSRIQKIAVIDNGHGMSPSTLQLALQFGNGTHLDDREGMGRFGMGLPNSSISQCRRLDVWTWQNGPDNAMHSYLDIGEIEAGNLATVPEPKAQPLPEEWRDRSEVISTTGTLVLWSEVDQLKWRTAKTTFLHTEPIIGRMYRKFINDGTVRIRLLTLSEDPGGESGFDQDVRVNDPLYLMADSSTPAPFDKEPMFQKWGEEDEAFAIKDAEGKEHEVIVRMSWAKEATAATENTGRMDRGSTEYGKHAAKNTGVSVLREGRELELDRAWANSYDPTERWWGVEIEFPAALDEIFGVTNSKQSATILSSVAAQDFTEELEPGESTSSFIERLEEEGDSRAYLLPIASHIKKQIVEIRNRIKKQTVGRRTPGKGRHSEAQDKATKKFNDRAQEGHKAEVDETEINQAELETHLVDRKNYPPEAAKSIVADVLKYKRKVEFIKEEMDGYAFFKVEPQQGGVTLIAFNTNHQFHEKIIEVLEANIDENESQEDLTERVYKASEALKLLFASWARYTVEEANEATQQQLDNMRQEWGKMARFFLDESAGG